MIFIKCDFGSCVVLHNQVSNQNVSLQVDVSARACIYTDRKIGKRDISRSGVSFVRRPTSRPNVTRSPGTAPAPPPPSLPNVTQTATHPTETAPALPVSSLADVAPAPSQLNSASLPDAIVVSDSAPEIPPPESSQRPGLEQRSSTNFDLQAVQNGQLRAVMYALFVNASGDNEPISAPAIIRLLFDRGLIIEHAARSSAPKQIGNQMVTLRNAALSQKAAHQRYAARVGSLLLSKAKVHMNGLERTGEGKSAAYRISAEFAEALGANLFS